MRISLIDFEGATIDSFSNEQEARAAIREMLAEDASSLDEVLVAEVADDGSTAPLVSVRDFIQKEPAPPGEGRGWANAPSRVTIRNATGETIVAIHVTGVAGSPAAITRALRRVRPRTVLPT